MKKQTSLFHFDLHHIHNSRSSIICLHIMNKKKSRDTITNARNSENQNANKKKTKQTKQKT